MNKELKENLIILCISAAFFLHYPAIVRAQEPLSPENFTKPLSLSRGKIFPLSQNGFIINKADACQIARKEWGWNEDGCNSIDAFVVNDPDGIDTLLVSKPSNDGYVKFDDWGDNVDENIKNLWDNFVKATSEQSRQVKQNILPVKWLVYPTLVRDKHFMYYAILLNWDGEPIVNAKASLFDRHGYVVFAFVPKDPSISKADLRNQIEQTLSSYKSDLGSSYSEFRNGDKVAAAGALGVLAALVGVKYGKTLLATVTAIALLVAKKLWLIIFVGPMVFFRKIFGKRNGKNSNGRS